MESTDGKTRQMKKLAFDTLKHLNINKGVKRATNEYQDEEDEPREFIEERCVLGPDEKIERSELHSVYLGWSGDHGTRMPLKTKAFNKRMRSREGIVISPALADSTDLGPRRYWLNPGGSRPAGLNAPCPLVQSVNFDQRDTDRVVLAAHDRGVISWR
jgi:hypothetical protein